MSKYTDMQDFYEHQVAHMQDRVDDWRNKAIERGEEICYMKGKLEVYEKLFRKFLKESPNDEVFIYQGKIYEPTSYTSSHERCSVDTLDVTFVERII